MTKYQFFTLFLDNILMRIRKRNTQENDASKANPVVWKEFFVEQSKFWWTLNILGGNTYFTYVLSVILHICHFFTHIIADKTTFYECNHITKYYITCNKIISPYILKNVLKIYILYIYIYIYIYIWMRSSSIFYAINHFFFRGAISVWTSCDFSVWIDRQDSTIMFIQQTFNVEPQIQNFVETHEVGSTIKRRSKERKNICHIFLHYMQIM
jgi:hypothetical protein